ncbi:MAG: PAS domain S-box protein, partial [Desulfobulbaceae bacterium]|nr:PAS domain S-box protein [Desulfobulbaceae bacterium]
NYWVVYHPDYQELTKERGQARMRQEEVVPRYEVKLQRKDGSWFYGEVNARPITFHSDQESGIQVWVKDIDERKRAEDSLRESEEKYRLVIENATDAIFIAQDEILKFANPKAEKMTGYSAQELAKIPFADIIHPEDRYMVLERHLKRLKGEELPSIYSFRILNKSGEELSVDLNTVLISWEGKPATLNFLRDITRQKRLEAQLQQAQKMEAIGTLAGGIAHDFNNILFPIIAYTEMLIDEAAEKSTTHEKLNLILKSAMRARDLVQQILVFSRQQEQKVMPLKAEIIVKEVLKFMKASLPSTIEIDINIADDCGLVLADPTNIYQIVMNLCTNAYHAMEKTGGRLGVTLSRVESIPEDVVGMDREVGPYLCLKVEDTGHGMEKEVMNRIFDPYYTTKEKGKGTGLGLAVVHGIVHSHGGEIRVQSEIGVGTVFQLFLPSIKTETPILETESISDLPKGNEKILVVDDEESITRLAEKMLGQLGYAVRSYTSSSKALLAFRRN